MGVSLPRYPHGLTPVVRKDYTSRRLPAWRIPMLTDMIQWLVMAGVIAYCLIFMGVMLVTAWEGFLAVIAKIGNKS